MIARIPSLKYICLNRVAHQKVDIMGLSAVLIFFTSSIIV